MLINHIEIEKEKIEGLISDIKKKKELELVDDTLILGSVTKFLRKNSGILRKLGERKDFDRFRKSSGYKKIIKYTRGELRKTVGAYSTKAHKQNKELLKGISRVLKIDDLYSKTSLDLHRQILSTHTSTKERVEIYERIYKKIFEITEPPDSVLDLGCGLNPISFPWMNLKKLDYHAIEVNEKDLDIVREYFKIIGINGHVKKLNLQKILERNILEEFPKADICFLFKVLESVELGKGHKLSERIITQVKSDWVVVSFATKTLSGRRMRVIKRIWFERMLKRLNLGFSKFQEEGELFYIFRKKI